MSEDRRALQSDHVNYLIWRYLQERGMGKTAVSLEREWNVSDPQMLPFSHAVAKDELISLIQHGLLYDDLAILAYDSGAFNSHTAHVALQPSPRRYQFVQPRNDRKRPASSSSDPEDGDRSIAGLDTARKRARIEPNGVRRTHHAVSTRRKSSKTSPQIPADDSMEVDEAEIMQDETINNDVEPTEEDRPPTPPTTLDVGSSAGVNTEPIVQTPVAQTLANFKVPHSDIIHVKWDEDDTSQLHVAGGSIWKTYQLSELPPPDVTAEPPYVPHASSKGSFFVSAVARHAASKRSAVAINEQNGAGDNYIQVVSGNADNLEIEIINRPQDNTLFLRFNENGMMLLGSSVVQVTTDSLESTVSRGYLNLWDLEKSINSTGVRLPEPALDGCWLSDSRFALSSNASLDIYEIRNGSLLKIHHIDTPFAWDFMKFDKAASQIACISCEARYLGILDVATSTLRTQQASSNDDAVLTAFSYQPLSSAEDDAVNQRLIATGFTDSTIKLWDPTSLSCVKEVAMHPLTPAMAIAFTKQGNMIAFAGERRIEIWGCGANGRRIALWDDDEALDATENTSGEEHSYENVDNEEDPWHALSWDASGEKLAYTQGSKISVIRLPT